MGDLLYLPVRTPPRGAVPPAIPVDVLALIDIDAATAETEELASLSSEKLDRLPMGSPAWSAELEHWVGLCRDLFDLDRMRERAMAGGLRLVKGGNGG